MVDGIKPEAAGLQDLSGLGKEAAHLSRSMGVGAHGQELSAQLPVAQEDLLLGMGVAQAVFEAGRVAFQGLSPGGSGSLRSRR